MFCLTFSLGSDDPPHRLSVDAFDLNEAITLAPGLIAAKLDRAGAFVILDQEKGRFTIGAGVWSRNGTYRLERVTEDATGPL